MKELVLLCLFVSSFACVSAQDLKTPDDEPKSTFEITVNGKKYNVSENEVLRLDTLIKPIITIKTSPYKKFNNPSLSFEYPAHLSYESAQSAGYKNWTLSGNSLVVMYFEIESTSSLSELVDEMVDNFGKKNCVVGDFQKELGGKMCRGKKINVTLAGQKILMECFQIVLTDSTSRFIFFQDSLENDKNSLEYKKGFATVDSTMNYKI